MGNAHVAGQIAHVAGMEHIANQSTVFAHMEAVALAGDYASRILPSVLQYR